MEEFRQFISHVVCREGPSPMEYAKFKKAWLRCRGAYEAPERDANPSWYLIHCLCRLWKQ